MTTVLIMWNIVLTYFCIRLLWDIVKLEHKVNDLVNEYDCFDKAVFRKLDDIHRDANIISRILEWRKQNETTTEKESL